MHCKSENQMLANMKLYFVLMPLFHLQAPISVFLGDSDGKESTCNAKDLGLTPWVGKIPWRREWLPTLVFWPGEFHGQGSLAGYSPWGHKESDMTE